MSPSHFLPLLLSLTLFNACKQQDEHASPSPMRHTVIYDTIDGVDSNLLSLDIYYNGKRSGKKPVVLWVHGGAWAVGDKQNNVQQKADLFDVHGWLFVSTNYRLSPFPVELDNPERIKYPTHSVDVASAIGWIHRNIETYGGDPSRIVLLGHSAGAHLVSLSGTNGSFLENVSVPFEMIKGIASIDTEGYDVSSKVSEGVEFYINAFGTDSLENRAASPLYNVVEGRIYPKFFIAKRGSRQRIKIADEFISKLQGQGITVDELNGSIYTHAGINDAIGAPGEQSITPALVAFIERCFD